MSSPTPSPADLPAGLRIDEPAKPAANWAALRALGRRELPESVTIAGRAYRRERTLQHSFFAATGAYRAEGDTARRIVVKLGRQASFCGFPLRWVGRWLGRREIAMYGRVQDLPGVPRCLGAVGDTGFAHDYVEGRPHWRYGPLPDAFFQDLQNQIGEMHRRDIAYVDLQKAENILVGDDGRPHLIDLQTAFWWPANATERVGLQRLLPHALGRRVLAWLIEGDRTHVLVHWRRSSPEGLTTEQRELSERRSSGIRFHARLRRPYRRVRRYFKNVIARGN